MQKLTKRDRRRFDEVCRKIREALHLEHWEHEYTLEPKVDEQHPLQFAQHRAFIEGRRIWVAVFPAFWGLEAEKQLTALIHEHIHALHQTQDQMIFKMIDWSHEADRRWAEMTYRKVNEHITDHTTSILYDLLKDRF